LINHVQFELEAAAGIRPLSDITRLANLESRGVVLDANVLAKLKIRAPNARSVEGTYLFMYVWYV
jgi:hypothetical protein